MSADTLEMMFREFCLPTMSRALCGDDAKRRGPELGLSETIAAVVRSRSGRPAGAQAERLLRESGLPSGKTLGNLEEGQLPAKVRRQLPPRSWRVASSSGPRTCWSSGCPGGARPTSCVPWAGNWSCGTPARCISPRPSSWCSNCWRPSGSCAWINCSRSWTVLTPSFLDDLGYVQQSREEMEVLFTFLAERYERRSVLLSSNLVFSKWDQIFKDPMTTMAAVDRLVHHAIILEFDGETLRVPRPKEKGGG